MKKSCEYNTLNAITSCLSKMNRHGQKIMLGTLFAFFQGAQSQCSNNLTFPYTLIDAPKNVGNCIPLEMPASTANTTISVILSLYNNFTNLTDKIIENCPNIVPLNVSHCCLIQEFTQLASFCKNSASVWGLKLLTDQGVGADPTELSLLEKQVDCPPTSSNLFGNIMLGFACFALLCAFLYLIYRFTRSTVMSLPRYSNNPTELTPLKSQP